MKTNQKIVVFFGICILILLGVLVFQYVKNSSGDKQAYFLEQDQKCKEALAVGSVPDPETPDFVRSDTAFFSKRLNTCIFAIAVSSKGANNQGQVRKYTTVRIYDHTANEDLQNLEIEEFYPTQKDLLVALESKVEGYK